MAHTHTILVRSSQSNPTSSATFPSYESMQIYQSRLASYQMNSAAESSVAHPPWWPLPRAGTTPKLRFDHKLSVKYAKDHRVSVTVCAGKSA